MSTRDPAQLRKTGPVPCPADLARTLQALRTAEGVTAAPRINADQLHAVEVGVGYRFADDLLALYAAAVPSLAAEFNMTLAAVVGHTGALRDARAAGDLIGLGCRKGVFLCLSMRSTDSAETHLLEYDVYDKSTSGSTPLGHWLAARASDIPPSANFAPEIFRELPAGSSGKRVLHKVFGEGRVLLEQGEGPTRKVKVDFKGVGLKHLQARFLEYVDEE